MAKGSGCWNRLPQLIIIIIVASLLAVGIFLAIPYLQGRPQYPEGTFPVVVAGNQVLVSMDPEQEVMFVVTSTPGAPGTGGQELVQIASPTSAILPSVQPTGTSPILPSPAPITPSPVPPTPRPSCVTFINYQVQQGDTLFSISRKHVTSIALMASKGISSTSLVPGRVISLPVGDPSCCTGGWRPYVVEEGDTWFGIARSCGITVDALLQGNRVSAGATLYMTSVICVP
jgi:LysM repeat protein